MDRKGAHRSYCDAVEQLSDKFLRERKIVPETMTPDQARDLLQAIRESDDPRIRDFNRTMNTAQGFEFMAAGIEARSQSDNSEESARMSRIWQSLHDKAAEVLDAFGRRIIAARRIMDRR